MNTTKYIVGFITILSTAGLNAQINLCSGNVINGSASCASIAGGEDNKITSTADHSFIAAGRYQTNSAAATTIGAGYWNTTTKDFSTIPGGRCGKTRSYGQLAYSGTGFSNLQGMSQFGLYVLRGSIAGTGTVELSLDGLGTEHITVPTDGSFLFDIDMACRSTSVSNSVAGNCFHAKLLVENINGNLGCQQLANTSLTAHNPALTATYFCTNSNFKISGTGEANNTVYWVATIRATELVKP